MSEVVEVRGVASELCVGQWVYDAEGSTHEARKFTLAREDSDGFEPVATVGCVHGPGRCTLSGIDDAQRRAWRAKHRHREGNSE